MKKNVGLKSVRDRVEWFLVDFSWGKCGMRFGAGLAGGGWANRRVDGG